MAFEAIANLVLLGLGIGVTVVWIISLVNYDGKGCTPGDDCDSCPFPCEYNKERKIP